MAGASVVILVAGAVVRRQGLPAPPAPRKARQSPPPAAAPVKSETARPFAGNDVEITSFATRDWHGQAREVQGEVINRGLQPAQSVKVRVSCEIEGRRLSWTVGVEPSVIPALGTASFKELVPLPWGANWTAQVEGSDQVVSEKPVPDAMPASEPPRQAWAPPPAREPALLSLGEWSWYLTTCCKVVRGTVYNRGDEAGTAQVRIRGTSGGQVLVDQTVPVSVGPKSEAMFDRSFPGTPAEDWSVELAVP